MSEKPYTAGELNKAVKKAKIRELREAMRATGDDLKTIVEHPEIIDRWTPAQRAWMLEHLELLMQESKKLLKDIQKHMGD